MFAASKAGLILVNLNPNYNATELEYCVNKVQMKAIIAAEGCGKLDYYDHFLQLFPELATTSDRKLQNKRWIFIRILSSIWPDYLIHRNRVINKRHYHPCRVPSLRTIIMFGMKRPNVTFSGTYPLAEVLGMGTKETKRRMEKTAAECRPDDPFNIQFTSGTTGSPKAATLSSFGLINSAYMWGNVKYNSTSYKTFNHLMRVVGYEGH